MLNRDNKILSWVLGICENTWPFSAFTHTHTVPTQAKEKLMLMGRHTIRIRKKQALTSDCPAVAHWTHWMGFNVVHDGETHWRRSCEEGTACHTVRTITFLEVTISTKSGHSCVVMLPWTLRPKPHLPLKGWFTGRTLWCDGESTTNKATRLQTQCEGLGREICFHAFISRQDENLFLPLSDRSAIKTPSSWQWKRCLISLVVFIWKCFHSILKHFNVSGCSV